MGMKVPNHAHPCGARAPAPTSTILPRAPGPTLTSTLSSPREGHQIMSPVVQFIFIAIVFAAAAFAAGYFFRQRSGAEAVQLAKEEAERLLEDARTRQKEMVLEAKEEAVRIKSAAEQDARERRTEVQKREQRLQQREENFERKNESLETRERGIAASEAEVEKAHEEVLELHAEQRRELERVSGLTAQQAHLQLMASIEEEAERDATQRIREIESRTKEEAARRARWIVAQAIQRCAAETTVETTQSMVPIPNEEMKGRIIGKEGRNIRAIESATGVDLIIDDTPEAVVLSSFDPVRREVARLALQRLISDGRIHPGRIEDVVRKAEQELDGNIREAGQKAIFEVGIHGVHPELVKLLGMLK